MKNNIFLATSLIILIGCGQSDKSDKKEQPENKESAIQETMKTITKPEKAVFDIKAAKIVFKFTGAMEEGTETLYFDDYGNIAVFETDKKSKFGNSRQTTIWQDKKSIIIDHEKKIISKSAFRPKATEAPSLADIPEAARKGINYEKLPSETIAGKTCEVWYNAKNNIKYWLWNKIDLKMQMQKAYVREAISVEEISDIPASVMEIPKDYKQ